MSGISYLFQLSASSKGTLQARIQEMMVSAIVNQHVKPGMALPSGRKLATQLKVSRNTFVLAYQIWSMKVLSKHVNVVAIMSAKTFSQVTPVQILKLLKRINTPVLTGKACLAFNQVNTSL